MSARSGRFTCNRRVDTLAEPIGSGQEPDAAELEDEVASMELGRNLQEGDDPGEAGSVVVDSNARDEGAQGAPPSQHDELGYLEHGLAQGTGATAGDPADAPEGTHSDPAYAPEGTHRDPTYAPLSAAGSTMSLASPRPPPPVQEWWRAAVIGGRGMEYPLSQCPLLQHPTLLLPHLYKLW